MATKPEWADILGPAKDFEAAVRKTRSVKDLPSVAVGAKEIALLTIFKEEQRFAFEPVMQALKFLSELDDWSHSFFVADRTESEFFDWRQMPLRQYRSFDDFYHQELEATWGKWSELQETYAKIVRHEITQQQGVDEIRNRAAKAQQIDANTPDLKEAHRPKKGSATEIDTTVIGRGTEYALAKLRKDRPNIHARVLAGEITAHAGMIEAGFRKKPVSKKLSKVERLQKKIADLTRAERRALWEFLAKEFGK